VPERGGGELHAGRSRRKEAGAKKPHVVLVHLLSATLLDRFEKAQVGKLTATSMAKVDTILRITLDIP
jgi:hypothetical protein